MDEPLEPAGPSDPAADPDPEDAPTTHRATRGSGFLRGLREIAIVVVTALVISALVRTFLLQAFWVPSGSMEETLIRGDRILVWKPGGDPGHGDVVVFKDPADWLADPIPQGGLRGAINDAAAFVGILPATSGDDLVKRVIGVGGDSLECCSPEGRIIRNGEPLDEPYIYPGDPTDQVVFQVEVPMGRVFVMGDHRSDSADSRFHLEEDDGTVPLENVVGTAEVIMWPVSRWATLPSYADDPATASGAGPRPIGP